MNAEEARAKALSINQGVNKKQLANIEVCIENAVAIGEFKNHYYKPLLPGVKASLEEHGYDVSEYNGGQRDGITITIEW